MEGVLPGLWQLQGLRLPGSILPSAALFHCFRQRVWMLLAQVFQRVLPFFSLQILPKAPGGRCPVEDEAEGEGGWGMRRLGQAKSCDP